MLLLAEEAAAVNVRCCDCAIAILLGPIVGLTPPLLHCYTIYYFCVLTYYRVIINVLVHCQTV